MTGAYGLIFLNPWHVSIRIGPTTPMWAPVETVAEEANAEEAEADRWEATVAETTWKRRAGTEATMAGEVTTTVWSSRFLKRTLGDSEAVNGDPGLLTARGTERANAAGAEAGAERGIDAKAEAEIGTEMTTDARGTGIGRGAEASPTSVVSTFVCTSFLSDVML